MSTENKKPRGARTTKKQIEIIVNFIETNKIIVSGKINPKDIAIVENKWEELTQLLNTSGHGPQKTVSQWKKAFMELKTNTKKRARDVYIAKNGTGDGPSTVKDLSETEARLMGILSKVCVKGAPIPEAGITDTTSIIASEELNEQMILQTQPDTISFDFPEVTVPIMDSPETPVIRNASNIRRRLRIRNSSISSNNNNLSMLVKKQTESTDNLSKSIEDLSQSIKLLAISIEKIAMK